MLKIFTLMIFGGALTLYWAESVFFMIFFIFSIFLTMLSNYLVSLDVCYFSTTFISSLLILMSLIIFLFSYSVSLKNLSEVSSFSLLKILLLAFSLSFFMMKNMLYLYIMFELSVLPIFMIIMGWGYQPERLSASISMFFYTLSASMPLLLNIVYVMGVHGTFSIFWLSLYSHSVKSLIMCVALSLAFLVKLPMYSVHLWLPKAHVEAPVMGSMILAAVLLKLGGFGMIIVSQFNLLKSFVMLFSSVSMLGMILVSLICLRMTDLKMIIAYSSVSHMGFLVFGVFSCYSLNYLGSQLMMVSHGFTSSAMFLVCYYFYKATQSRSILINKGMLVMKPFISVLWFFILASNMAAPPTLNFVSELLLIMSSIKISYSTFMIFIISIMLSSAYTLIMYSTVSQGQMWFFKTHLGSNEILIPLFHVWWVFAGSLLFIVLKLEKLYWLISN